MRTAFAVSLLAAIALLLAVPASGALAQSSCLNEGDSCVINGVSGTCRQNPDCSSITSTTCDANICVPKAGACTSAGASCTTSTGGNGFCAYDDTNGQLFCQANSTLPLTGGTNTGTTQTGGTNTGVGLINPLKAGTSLEGLLNDILAFVIRIGTVVIILMIVYVGFKFVTARGNPGEIEDAKKALLWTVVGALILLGAQAIAIGLEATVKAFGG